MKHVFTSAILTAILLTPVRNYAIAHHQQFNLVVVALLFATILSAGKMIREFRQIWTLPDDYDDDGGDAR